MNQLFKTLQKSKTKKRCYNKAILRHEDKVLRHGKIIRQYLIKFKNYPFEDARWMQGIQLKDSMNLVNAYNATLE
ncbi:hypothetical protein DD599_26435 [Enterobacter cloacae complex sp. CH23B]|nr:hypothetical protein DD599_26435 [Enterobacter cloacae complex sp. CH23B]